MHRPKTIGVLTPFLGGHYYSDIIRSIQQTTKKLGINIILIKTGGKCFDVPIAMDHVDGWLIINYAVEDYYLRQIEEIYQKPIVSIAKDVQKLNINAGMVVADNEQAVVEAVAHLYEHGHQRIGFLGNLDMDDMKSRFNGYLSAMNHLQLEINKNYIYDYGDMTVFGGKKAAQKIIAEHFPITAAVVCSDLCAYGMIEAFTEHGYIVPEQFALISFDNSPIAQNCNVPIASIEQNIDILTEQAVKNLLLRIEMPQDFAIEKIPCQLYKRDSCGCLTSDHSVTKEKSLADENWQHQNYSIATEQHVTYEFNKYILGFHFKKLEDLTSVLESYLDWGCVSRQNGYDTQNLPKLMITEYYQFTNRENTLAQLKQFQNERLQAFPPRNPNLLAEEQQITYIVPYRMMHNNWSLLAIGTSYQKAEIQHNEGLRLIHLFDMMAISFERLALTEESSQIAQQHHQMNIRQGVLNRLTEELFFEIDFEKQELWFNQNVKYTVQQSLLLGLEDYIHPDDLASLKRHYLEHLRESKPFYIELRVKMLQDSYVNSIIKAESTRDNVGNVLRLIGTIRDASKYGRAIKHAEQDERMTSMFNRKHFNEVIKQKLANEYQKFAVCVLNLDNFKIINDSYGHQIGDDIIELVSHILMMNIKTMDHISCFGGDEFIILYQYEQEYQLDEFTTTITEVINKQVLELYNEINMTVSIGISLFPYDGREYDMLLKKADLALFQVKHNGKNNILKFESYMINFQQDKRKIERQLREGLAHNQFSLVFQPQMDAKTQKLYGIEVLLRLQLSDGMMLSPDRFIPVAESVGLIVPLGEWVLREACKQGVAWIKQGYKPIKISINISRHQLKSIQFISTVRRILEETEMNPAYLTFEITETTIIDQSYVVLNVIEELRAFGITVAIDDFGVSYSSLSVLKNFPIEILKIDQSFVREMNDSEKSYKIIKAIINIAKSLDLRIVAEGVEELSQWDMLEQLGCHYIQGYYISKPVDKLEIVSFFTNKVVDAGLHITKD